jgi:hypothetical protein
VAALCIIMAIYAGFMMTSCLAGKVVGLHFEACGVR